MCGIVGYVGPRAALDVVVEGLRRLEYRGYDSAGVAIVGADGALQVEKKAGRIENLDKELAARTITGSTGMGHTRWATHGAPERPQRAPARRHGRAHRRGAQRDHRELRRVARRGRGVRHRVRQRDRHRDRRAPGRRTRRVRHARWSTPCAACAAACKGRSRSCSSTPSIPSRSSPPGATRRWSSGSVTARRSSAATSPRSSSSPATRWSWARTRSSRSRRDGYTITDFDGARRRRQALPHRLGSVGRREGRLRLLHAQGDPGAARRGRRHAARPPRRRRDRAGRAAHRRPRNCATSRRSSSSRAGRPTTPG